MLLPQYGGGRPACRPGILVRKAHKLRAGLLPCHQPSQSYPAAAGLLDRLPLSSTTLEVPERRPRPKRRVSHSAGATSSRSSRGEAAVLLPPPQGGRRRSWRQSHLLWAPKTRRRLLLGAFWDVARRLLSSIREVEARLGATVPARPPRHPVWLQPIMFLRKWKPAMDQSFLCAFQSFTNTVIFGSAAALIRTFSTVKMGPPDHIQ